MKHLLFAFPPLAMVMGMIVGRSKTFSDKNLASINYLISGVLFAFLATAFKPLLRSSAPHKFYILLGTLITMSLLITLTMIDNEKNQGHINTISIIDTFMTGYVRGISADILSGTKNWIFALSISFNTFFGAIATGEHMGRNGETMSSVIKKATLLGCDMIVGELAGIYMIKNHPKTPLFYSLFSASLGMLIWSLSSGLNSQKHYSPTNALLLYTGFTMIMMSIWYI
jgi:hypothetical protein